MISYLANVISLFASIIQSTWLVASVIGKLIVIIVTEISSILYSIIESVVLFLQIVYEDNISIFTEELPSFATDTIDTVNGQFLYLQNCFIIFYNDVHLTLKEVVGTVKWLVDAVFTVVCEVIILVATVMIVLGDSLWFILTFIPVHLPELLKFFFKFIVDIFVDTVVDAYMTLLKLTNFLTDVPLESFIGITSAIIIVRLCIHFSEGIQSQLCTLYWSIVRNFLCIYYAVYNYFTDSEVRVITRMTGAQNINNTRDVISSTTMDDAGDGADTLCVICQERQKCVLTLPCRHVCLCTECCMRLYGYQRTCPICRTFIYHSVTVYL